MSITFTVRLSPADLRLEVPSGTPFRDVLFERGVEFPCGGRGRCKGCRVKVLKGALPISPEERNLLEPTALADGWRLACRHSVASDLVLELAQWEMQVLGDNSAFEFKPQPGLGVAIDVGTTTIVAQLLDLQSGNVLAVSTALNAQARHGADVMSRIDYGWKGGQPELTRLLREQLGQMIAQMLAGGHSGQTLARVILVGNTVMHHLFCGLDLAPLAVHPFEPEHPERFRFAPQDLGWELANDTVIEFLPCLGGFVGSDVLAGIAATGLHHGAQLRALIDLGTNGEVVVAKDGRLLCTSTAAGPAFEGARISMGMRAASGAISEVRVQDNQLVCRVLGGGEPRGLCGSGLVDAVAAGLDLGSIRPDGRMPIASPMPLAGTISLLPSDVRQLQLAKGAIAAGLKILTSRFGASLEQLEQVQLAGAFGNYISRTSAQRIGLLSLPLERVRPAGNTALLGAKRALFESAADWERLRAQTQNIALNQEPNFEEIYAHEMRFPG